MNEELANKYVFIDKHINFFNRKKAICLNCYTCVKPSQIQQQRGFCAKCGSGTFYIRERRQLLHAFILKLKGDSS